MGGYSFRWGWYKQVNRKVTSCAMGQFSLILLFGKAAGIVWIPQYTPIKLTQFDFTEEEIPICNHVLEKPTHANTYSYGITNLQIVCDRSTSISILKMHKENSQPATYQARLTKPWKPVPISSSLTSLLLLLHRVISTQTATGECTCKVDVCQFHGTLNCNF